ncbi:MAG: hypothetical protein OK455_09315, partial [Thaumarchaeota archaeon]|nr:hypothetical protein [Nitrososphaerota archaeon]
AVSHAIVQGPSLARLTSPYASFVQVSKDGGKTWQLPAEGPSEYSYRAVLSKQVLGPGVSGIPQVRLNSGQGEFAQPIRVSTLTQVKGVYLGIFTRQTSGASNNYMRVSITPDNGGGTPSQQPLASGVFYGDNMTFESPDLVQFTSTAKLSPGETYWLVVQPVGGDYNVYPVVYLNTPSGNSSANALISYNSGFTWGGYASQTTILSYALVSPTMSNPTYDTQQLYKDLAAFHNFPTDALPLKGWNAYVQTSQMQMLREVATWLGQNTSRGFEFDVSAQPTVISATASTMLSPLPLLNPFPDCTSLQNYLLRAAPTTDAQFYVAGNLPLLNKCAGTLVKNYARLLNQIPFLPDGQGSGTNINTSSSASSSSASSSSNSASSSSSITANVNTTLIPISSPVWQAGNGSAQSPDISYSISGGYHGPLVVWVSNSGTSPEKLS